MYNRLVMNVSKLKSSEVAKITVLSAVLMILLITTHPQDAPLLLLFLPFILLYLISYKSLKLLFNHSSFRYIHKPKTVAVLFSGFILSLLLLKSINQLSPQDVALLVIFALFLIFYIQRNGFGSSE